MHKGLNAHADVFSGAKGLIFGLSLSLYPYFVHVRSIGFGETGHMHRLV